MPKYTYTQRPTIPTTTDCGCTEVLHDDSPPHACPNLSFIFAQVISKIIRSTKYQVPGSGTGTTEKNVQPLLAVARISIQCRALYRNAQQPRRCSNHSLVCNQKPSCLLCDSREEPNARLVTRAHFKGTTNFISPYHSVTAEESSTAGPGFLST